MKSRFLLIALSFYFALSIQAGEVTLDEARRVAKNFLYEKTHMPQKQISFDEELAVKENEEVFYYIFNEENNNGFVIVAAEDQCAPILAYSLKNRFAVESEVSNLEAWMQLYKEQILYMRETEVSESMEAKRTWGHYNQDHVSFTARKAVGKSVEPLTEQINWHQAGGASQGWEGWNGMCPGEGEEQACAGCIATAMGIIMYYWKHPISGVGSNTYYCQNYGLLSVDFSEATYFWANMLDNKPTYYSALLLYHLGVSVNMAYSPEASGAMASVTDALQSHFKYSTSEMVSRSDYSDTEWMDSILKPDLDNSLPIFYCGTNNEIGRHAFVCDGYDENDMFHFNWGLGGYSNGYFLITGLGHTNGWVGNQTAIYNIQPTGNYPHKDSPQNLTAELDTLDLETYKVDVSWDAPDIDVKQLTGYDLCLGDSIIAEDLSVDVTTYVDTDIEPGLSDYYAVRAKYTDGQSLCSSDYFNGMFEVKFWTLDPQTLEKIFTSEVIFGGDTVQSNMLGASFSVPFGSNYYVRASAENYPVTEKRIDVVYKDMEYNIVMDGAQVYVAEHTIDDAVIYPNPSNTGVFYLSKSSVSDIVSYTVINSNGIKLIESKYNRGEKINLSNYPPGMYFVNLNQRYSTTTLKVFVR